MKKRIIKKNNKLFACKVMSYALISAMLVGTVSVAPMNTIIAGAEERPITIMLDGEEVHTKVAPKLMNGTTYLPLVDVANLTGSTVEWDNATKSAKVDQGAKRATFTQGKDVRIINGRTLVAIRRVAESLGLRIGWNQKLYRISIETGVQPQPTPKPSKPQAGLQGLKAGDYLVVQNHLGTFTCPRPLYSYNGKLCVRANHFLILTGFRPEATVNNHVPLLEAYQELKGQGLHWEGQTLVCTANDPYGLIEKRLSEARTRMGNPSLTYSEYIDILKSEVKQIDQENAIDYKSKQYDEAKDNMPFTGSKDVTISFDKWVSLKDGKTVVDAVNKYRKYMGVAPVTYDESLLHYRINTVDPSIYDQQIARAKKAKSVVEINSHQHVNLAEIMTIGTVNGGTQDIIGSFTASSKHASMMRRPSFTKAACLFIHEADGTVQVTIVFK